MAKHSRRPECVNLQSRLHVRSGLVPIIVAPNVEKDFQKNTFMRSCEIFAHTSKCKR